jgi:hypothetical protein
VSATDPNNPDFFEAVYYSNAVPRTLEALTMLGLVFDKLYFPAVHMPSGFDEKGVIAEIKRIKDLNLPDPGTAQLLECLEFALHHKHLTDFCVFSTDSRHLMERLEPGTYQVVDTLEEMVFGPRPEGNIPIHSSPWVKGLPGNDEAKCQIIAPDTITYPANALLFATRNQLPLINDVPWLPVPGIPGEVKGNAKLLATILAMESVAFVLPKIKPLTPEALKDFREELSPHVKPFRLAMLRLTKELNAAIEHGATLPEAQKHAKFLVETEVFPNLAELEAVIQNPKKHWYRRAADLAKDAPVLVGNFFKLPMGVALTGVLIKILGTLVDIRDEQVSKDSLVTKNGLYYLLKLKERG